MKITITILVIIASLTCGIQAQESTTYSQLTQLFKDWRKFENPPKLEGAPDYRFETFTARQPAFEAMRKQLSNIDTSGWKISEKVDWKIVWAEMNGYSFNRSVLRPWMRDPAFYKVVWTGRSDVPGHEGPTNHGVIELWQYEFPLSKSSRGEIMKELSAIVPFYEQAKQNLTGNARDLWVTGIRDIRSQKNDLLSILDMEGVASDEKLTSTIKAAIESTEDLVSWLEEQASSKVGPSGIGKQNYTWYLQNVHLVPLTWEDEVMILKRELARAWSTLKLEEHRNRLEPGQP